MFSVCFLCVRFVSLCLWVCGCICVLFVLFVFCMVFVAFVAFQAIEPFMYNTYFIWNKISFYSKILSVSWTRTFLSSINIIIFFLKFTICQKKNRSAKNYIYPFIFFHYGQTNAPLLHRRCFHCPFICDYIMSATSLEIKKRKIMVYKNFIESSNSLYSLLTWLFGNVAGGIKGWK